MSFRKVILFIIPAVLAVSAIIYAFLGGFKAPEVVLIALEGDYRLVGKPYVGTLKNPELNKLLDEVGRRWESGEIPGVLTVAILKEPVTDKDTVEQFIGILLPAGPMPQTLPQGYEIMQLAATKAIRVSLDANAAVWPTPDKLLKKAEAFAAEKGYRLQPGIHFEKYQGPSRLEVELPVLDAPTAH